ncbi:MAG TPA: efflux RND transporter permease subunit [Myxococcales bacterium LLY-WYZ-16_1]|nr:efflux RND transporter permease subunit [Myxococcales bacterium LLY-WYZ-16_1]
MARGVGAPRRRCPAQLLRNGSKLAEAIDLSVRKWLRPIFRSALTSLAGLSPLVFFPGSGSELYRGVGSIVLGGLALSTVLTAFVVPALFSLLECRQRS